MLWMAERLEEEGDRMLQVQLVLWEGKCGGEGDLAAVWTTATALNACPPSPHSLRRLKTTAGTLMRSLRSWMSAWSRAARCEAGVAVRRGPL